VRFDSRAGRRDGWNWGTLLGLLFLNRQLSEVGPDLARQLVLDSARVRSLVGDADL
jgi:hypothetical protein